MGCIGVLLVARTFVYADQKFDQTQKVQANEIMWYIKILQIHEQLTMNSWPMK